MPPARPPRPAIGAVDTPPATLSHTSTIGLLLASTAIAFAITAVALIGVGVGALGIGRQTASNREETAPPSEGVGKIEKKNPPAAAPEEKGVDQKPSNSQPPPPVAPPAPPAPGAPAAVPVPPASPAKPDPSQAVALIAIFNPKSGNYDIMTVGWAVDERHFVTLGIPYAGREQRQFVAFVGKHRIILSHAAYHPRLREAIALRNREDVLKEGQAYDLAVFRTPMPIIPGRLELTPVKNADLRDAARLLGFAERAGEIGLDQAIPFRDYQVGPLPTEPDRVIVTQDIADGPTLLGGPVLDSHGRVIGMVQPSVENGAAKVVSARVIHELIETLPKSGP